MGGGQLEDVCKCGKELDNGVGRRSVGCRWEVVTIEIVATASREVDDW